VFTWVTTTTLGVIVDVLMRVAVGEVVEDFDDVVDFSKEVFDVEVWVGVWVGVSFAGGVVAGLVVGVFGAGVGVSEVVGLGVGVGVSAGGGVEEDGVGWASVGVDGGADVGGVLGSADGVSALGVALVVGVAAAIVTPVPAAEPVSCRTNMPPFPSNNDA
jgi:hypothetical protein